MTDKIDITREHTLRNGWEVRLYANDLPGKRPILAAYYAPGLRVWCADTWPRDGWFYPDRDSQFDLIPKPYITSDMIPWDHIHPDIKWVAGDRFSQYSSRSRLWYGYAEKPSSGEKSWCGSTPSMSLRGVAGMPEYDPERWRETLVKRPEGR
jgi:hypothetical protein